jgi:hypothetical protein
VALVSVECRFLHVGGMHPHLMVPRRRSNIMKK